MRSLFVISLVLVPIIGCGGPEIPVGAVYEIHGSPPVFSRRDAERYAALVAARADTSRIPGVGLAPGDTVRVLSSAADGRIVEVQVIHDGKTAGEVWMGAADLARLGQRR